MGEGFRLVFEAGLAVLPPPPSRAREKRARKERDEEKKNAARPLQIPLNLDRKASITAPKSSLTATGGLAYWHAMPSTAPE